MLDFNVEKCGFMVFGSKRSKRIIENQLSQTPLTLKGENVRNVKVEKYLGDYLSEDGLSDSVHRTVLKRKGQTIACINEIRAILEDCRSGVIGGITVGLEIWELGIIPALLNNSDTWVDMSLKTLKELDSLQYMFYRTLLSTPRTCPLPILLWDTGALLMEHRIALKKLMFYHHLKHLEEESLASKIATI